MAVDPKPLLLTKATAQVDQHSRNNGDGVAEATLALVKTCVGTGIMALVSEMQFLACGPFCATT